jgi:cytochrome c oxidase subunit 3
MIEERREIDLSELPGVVFDHHNSMWWGAVAFILIEGFTLVLMAAAYLYLRINELEWPPGRTPPPDVLIPTINMIWLLLITVPMRLADKAARHYNRPLVMKWLWIGTAMSGVAAVLRWFEMTSLHVTWDAHAYGSAAWGVLVLHGTLILADVLETGVLATMFTTGRAMKKHYPDVSDAAMYQYFLSGVYVPLYVLVYWGPRLF